MKGSTGTVKDCFKGSISVLLYLQGADNNYYHKTINMFVAQESLELPSILGVDFLKSVNSNLSFDKHIDIQCTMLSNKEKNC